jgi:signal transduction histidine kinase
MTRVTTEAEAEAMQSKSHRFGLLRKLVLAILAVGTIPLVVGLSVAYVRGSSELQEVIGASFQVLAEESASKLDAEIQRIITADRLLAQKAAANSAVHTKLSGNRLQGKRSPEIHFDWPPVTATGSVPGALKASWITSPESTLIGSESTIPYSEKTTTKASVHLNSTTQHHLLHISTPIYNEKEEAPVGWLQRDYDIKKLFDPLVYPIRFGDTGHVMLIDNLGAIISCPLLITGSRIEDRTLLTRVASDEAGWISAENDGHGGHVFSIVGYAPLASAKPFLQQGKSWHMFVWQDSSEIFAPARSLLIGVSLAGLLSLGLLVALGYYASSHIVRPIQRLRHEASRIAAGDLSQTLAIHTDDEIGELAGELNEMRIQLRHHIGTLEEKVDDRTRKLIESQAEKNRVIEQLIQTEKVAAIGIMASGIGHEINNPLYVIMGSAEAIRDEKDVSECNKLAQSIIKQANQISIIVKNLSGYIRPASQHELEKVDVNKNLTEALAMVKPSLLDDRVKIYQNFMYIPEICARPEEVQQVFFNVIRNGIQAMAGEGTLEVATYLENNRVCIRIQDTGKGIQEKHLGKIFDPFFTTKGPDEGEGLGMYIVQQIVNKYDGTISLKSQEGKGTAVTIQFPSGEPTQKEN